MQLKDYEYYQKTSEGGCKSQMKDFINLYSKILKRVKKESASELDGVKINIKRRYPQEVYLTLMDEINFKIMKTYLIMYNIQMPKKDMKRNSTSSILDTIVCVASKSEPNLIPITSLETISSVL